MGEKYNFLKIPLQSNYLIFDIFPRWFKHGGDNGGDDNGGNDREGLRQDWCVGVRIHLFHMLFIIFQSSAIKYSNNVKGSFAKEWTKWWFDEFCFFEKFSKLSIGAGSCIL